METNVGSCGFHTVVELKDFHTIGHKEQLLARVSNDTGVGKTAKKRNLGHTINSHFDDLE